jgi:hypothetical protein
MGIDIDAIDKDGNTAAWTFKHLRPVVPTAEEQRAFDLLVASVIPIHPPRQSSSRSLPEEEDSDMETQKFFSAAASFGSSFENSLENSIDDLKSLPGRGPATGNWILRAPRISSWIGSLWGKRDGLLDPSDFFSLSLYILSVWVGRHFGRCCTQGASFLDAVMSYDYDEMAFSNRAPLLRHTHSFGLRYTQYIPLYDIKNRDNLDSTTRAYKIQSWNQAATNSTFTLFRLSKLNSYFPIKDVSLSLFSI